MSNNITHGMNVEEVRRLGADLNALGQQLDDMAKRLEGCVTGATWVGPDSRRFKQEWWPKHRSRVQAIANDLRGFGDSAKNNADEQERISGGATNTGSGPTGPSGPTGGNDTPSAPKAGGGFPGWGAPLDDATAKAIADKYTDAGMRKNFDFVNGDGAGDDWYQCTSWARARWRQMGYVGPEWSGDGENVATNINNMFGTTDPGRPSVGAIMSDPSMGHVAVVEEVQTLPDGRMQFKVSEMNMGGDGWRSAAPWEFRVSDWQDVRPNLKFAEFRRG